MWIQKDHCNHSRWCWTSWKNTAQVKIKNFFFFAMPVLYCKFLVSHDKLYGDIMLYIMLNYNKLVNSGIDRNFVFMLLCFSYGNFYSFCYLRCGACFSWSKKINNGFSVESWICWSSYQFKVNTFTNFFVKLMTAK